MCFDADSVRRNWPQAWLSTPPCPNVEHLFVRWDDPNGERFNIEATSLGLNSYPDEYYLTWPKKLTPEQVAKGDLMRSLPPRAELAEMLAMRGNVLRDNYKFGPALEEFYHAQRLDPLNPIHEGHRAVITVLHNESSGLARYGLNEPAMPGYVLEKGMKRPLAAWERWAVPEARKTLQRLIKLHN